MIKERIKERLESKTLAASKPLLEEKTKPKKSNVELITMLGLLASTMFLVEPKSTNKIVTVDNNKIHFQIEDIDFTLELITDKKIFYWQLQNSNTNIKFGTNGLTLFVSTLRSNLLHYLNLKIEDSLLEEIKAKAEETIINSKPLYYLKEETADITVYNFSFDGSDSYLPITLYNDDRIEILGETITVGYNFFVAYRQFETILKAKNQSLLYLKEVTELATKLPSLEDLITLENQFIINDKVSPQIYDWCSKYITPETVYNQINPFISNFYPKEEIINRIAHLIKMKIDPEINLIKLEPNGDKFNIKGSIPYLQDIQILASADKPPILNDTICNLSTIITESKLNDWLKDSLVAEPLVTKVKQIILEEASQYGHISSKEPVTFTYRGNRYLVNYKDKNEIISFFNTFIGLANKKELIDYCLQFIPSSPVIELHSNYLRLVFPLGGYYSTTISEEYNTKEKLKEWVSLWSHPDWVTAIKTTDMDKLFDTYLASKSLPEIPFNHENNYIAKTININSKLVPLVIQFRKNERSDRVNIGISIDSLETSFSCSRANASKRINAFLVNKDFQDVKILDQLAGEVLECINAM